ncbi:hypothetical protein [Clostridium sp. B9]
MDNVDIVIEKICNSIKEDFEEHKENEFTLEMIKALAELLTARAI